MHIGFPLWEGCFLPRWQNVRLGAGGGAGAKSGPSCSANLGDLKLTSPKFNIALKNDGWKTTFLFGRPIFGGFVKFPGSTKNIFFLALQATRFSFFSCYKWKRLSLNLYFLGNG